MQEMAQHDLIRVVNVFFNKGENFFIIRRFDMNEAFLFYKSFLGGNMPKQCLGSITMTASLCFDAAPNSMPSIMQFPPFLSHRQAAHAECASRTEPRTKECEVSP